MRRTETSMMFRALRLAVVPLVIGFTASAARAGDDDRTISEKIMDGFYGAIRGTNMDNRGIDYRERSPLVVPPTLDLPPPAATTEVPVANWPKDPDERQRKAVIAAKKKNAPPPARVQVSTDGATAAPAARPVNIAPPVEAQASPAAPGTTRPAYASDRNGTALIDPIYDQPGDLFKGGTSAISGWGDSIGLGGLFGSKSNAVPVQPGTEPVREALTQPPLGYQTPSPNYSYGLQPRGLFDGESNPDRSAASQRSSASSVVH